MLSAKEARKIVEENKKQRIENSLLSLITLIKQKSYKEETELRYSAPLTEEQIQYLRLNGFNIIFIDEEKYIIIRW